MNSEIISLVGNQHEQQDQESKKLLFDSLHRVSSVTKWCVAPVIVFFPNDRIEECLGDLLEVLSLISGKYPKLFIDLIIIIKTVILIISALEIRFSDLLLSSLRSKI